MREYFVVNGGNQLTGTIDIQGAKNEALEVISAALLSDQPITIHNLPDILDVREMLELIKYLGADIDRLDEHTYKIQTKNLSLECFDNPNFIDKAGRVRTSLLFAGPLLARLGQARIIQPGGDQIGLRHIDVHINGLCALGVQVQKEGEALELRTNGLTGTEIFMDEASVTATANIVMAAVLAHGKTTIYPAACEPHIQQLCKMLNNMGAKIEGIGTNKLIIDGVKELGEAEHTIDPDIIEVASFIAIGAMTGNGIKLRNVANCDYGAMFNAFSKLGVNVEKHGSDLFIPHHEHYKIQGTISGNVITIYDQIWPGLSPDIMSIALTIATQADGQILFHQRMFEGRLFFTDQLISMGANIVLCDPHRALVIGHDRKRSLSPSNIFTPDIRAGLALLIAALSADGQSLIRNVVQIDRGYEKIDKRLRSLGADIQRIPEET